VVVLTSHEASDAEHYVEILEGLLAELGLKTQQEEIKGNERKGWI
jgi:hypothetical protein